MDCLRELLWPASHGRVVGRGRVHDEDPRERSNTLDHPVAVLTLRVLNRDRSCSLILTMSSPDRVADNVLRGQAVTSMMQRICELLTVIL